MPQHLLDDPIYQGGVLKQSAERAERDPNKPVTDDEYGWSAKMWEPAVRARYQQLVRQLGQEFDGKITGINFSESSIEVGTENADGTTTFPSDFNPKDYIDAIGENMQVLAESFQHSTAMVYLNFTRRMAAGMTKAICEAYLRKPKRSISGRGWSRFNAIS